MIGNITRRGALALIIRFTSVFFLSLLRLRICLEGQEAVGRLFGGWLNSVLPEVREGGGGCQGLLLTDLARFNLRYTKDSGKYNLSLETNPSSSPFFSSSNLVDRRGASVPASCRPVNTLPTQLLVEVESLAVSQKINA